MLASLFMREISEMGTGLGILNEYIVDMNTTIIFSVYQKMMGNIGNANKKGTKIMFKTTFFYKN